MGADGAGYVLEIDADGLRGPGAAGRLVRVNANGTQTGIGWCESRSPWRVTIGPDGALYVTNFSTSAGTGEVVRIVP